jgi:anti-sigma-K factor RskA
MTDDRSITPADRDLAAEYALGVLTGAELERARALARGDARFRADVARWRGRLAPLLDELEPAVPPSSAWAQIEERLQPRSADTNVVQLRRRVSLWRGIAAGATALAASLAAVLLAGLPQPTPVQVRQPAKPPLVALVADPIAGTKLVASWDPAERQLVMAVPGELRALPGRSHELWVIPPGGKPRSLGVLPNSKQSHRKLADALARLLDQGATIAISVEPQGGSPTGAPTGPVIASGTLTTA